MGGAEGKRKKLSDEVGKGDCSAVLVVLPVCVQPQEAALSCCMNMGGRGPLAEGAAVRRALLCRHRRFCSSLCLRLFLLQLTSLLLLLLRNLSPALLDDAGVAGEVGGWMWRDEGCCCPLEAPQSLSFETRLV